MKRSPERLFRLRRNRARGHLLVLLAVLTSAALMPASSPANTSGLAPTQSSAPASQPCAGNLRREHLIAPGKGWLVIGGEASRSVGAETCAGQLLYWTGNNGRTWRDITPPGMPTNTIGEVFFLNSSHGWMLSSDALSEETNAQFYLFSTVDGGKNWRTLLLTRPMFGMNDDYTFPIQLFFSDASHGWMMWHWGIMNSSINYLLATTDGGLTCKRLPEPPGPGPLQFLSPREGWMIGGLVTPDGIPDYENENLRTTHDGGLHWDVVSVPLPGIEDEETSFSAFRFKDSQQGGAVVTLQRPGNLSPTFTCFTHDGGRTWKISPLDLDADHAAPSFVSNHIIWSISDSPDIRLRIQTETSVITPVLPPESSVGRRMSDVDFVEDHNGWVIAWRTELAPDLLLKTTDGGRTFRAITPPGIVELARKRPTLF